MWRLDDQKFPPCTKIIDKKLIFANVKYKVFNTYNGRNDFLHLKLHLSENAFEMRFSFVQSQFSPKSSVSFDQTLIVDIVTSTLRMLGARILVIQL